MNNKYLLPIIFIGFIANSCNDEEQVSDVLQKIQTILK